MKSRIFLNDLLLLITAAIWGLAFVAQRAGMEHLGPFSFNGFRFFLGAVVLIPIALRWAPLAGVDLRRTGRAGLTAGLVLFAGAGLQQIGIVHTTAGNAGFITGLYVVMVPLMGIGRRQTMGVLRWTAILPAVAGLYLLSVQSDFSVNIGDLYVMASAFFFAVHVQVIDYVSRRCSALWLSIVQYLVVALASLLVSIPLETVTPDGLRGALIPVLYGGIGSISIAYTLQVIAQRRAPASHAAILLSMEGTFAALGGWLLLSEVLTARALLGCALLLTGMILSQISGLRSGRSPEATGTPVPAASPATVVTAAPGAVTASETASVPETDPAPDDLEPA